MSTADLEKLLGLKPAGEIRWGLRRTRVLLQSVGSPHMKFRSLHIGGTNGKGSVGAMAASVLATAGHRVGLYTSPHLVDFRERIRIDGALVDGALVTEGVARLQPIAREIGATFFETTTALAFYCFAEEGIDLAVAEVGLGGRLDATNVLLPEVSVITQVAWDHADYLGHSISSIAREKAGIAKPGVPLVLGRLEPEAGRIVRETAEGAGALVRQLGRDAAVRRIRTAADHTALEYVGLGSEEALRLRTPLLGAHQAWNAGVAALGLESLPPDLRPTAAQIRDGIRRARWPGRMQLERRDGRTWLFDVGHNAVAVEALAQAMAGLDLPSPISLVLAILGDKPWSEMLPPLLAIADLAIFTVAPSSPAERRWDPRVAAGSVRGYPVEVIEDFGRALECAATRGSTVVVTGSSYTVGDAMRALDIPVPLGLPPARGGE